MSSSLVSSLYGGQEAAFQEQLKRQFRENLARDPVAMAAFEKATGNQTPWSSPSALSALQSEQKAAAQRANQLAAGREAVAAKKMEQEAFGPRPSGLLQSQVVELPGGGKAVYDREGRLVGTNIPVDTGMSAVDRAAFNRGEGLASERSALRPAMEDAVRKAMEARVAAQADAAPSSAYTPLGGPAEVVVGEETGFMESPPVPTSEARGPASPTVFPAQPFGFSEAVQRLPFLSSPQTMETAKTLSGPTLSDAFSIALSRQPRSAPPPPTDSDPFSETMRGTQGAPKKQEADVASSLLGRGLVPEVQQGLFSSALGLYDLYRNLLARPLDRALFGIPIPETPSSTMEDYQRSLGRPTGWTGGL